MGVAKSPCCRVLGGVGSIKGSLSRRVRVQGGCGMAHEVSYSKTGGHVLTVKFGKARSHHRLRVNIGWNQPIGGISRWESPSHHAIVFLVESDQSKEAYLEEFKFKEDAAWQFIY
uniref:Uncharacterized protein n=1 Tax=Oryza meridionalis TaxID=40149 RepID=A0A0E0F9J3_9ORYZ